MNKAATFERTYCYRKSGKLEYIKWDGDFETLKAFVQESDWTHDSGGVRVRCTPGGVATSLTPILYRDMYLVKVLEAGCFYYVLSESDFHKAYEVSNGN